MNRTSIRGEGFGAAEKAGRNLWSVGESAVILEPHPHAISIGRACYFHQWTASGLGIHTKVILSPSDCGRLL